MLLEHGFSKFIEGLGSYSEENVAVLCAGLELLAVELRNVSPQRLFALI